MTQKFSKAYRQQRRISRTRLGYIVQAATTVLAVANFGLVLFDKTYIASRDLYLRYIPSLPPRYDLVKGIEPHRDTQLYLATVDRLQQQLTQTGLQNTQVDKTLAQLRDQSVAMIDEDPFQIANKSGTLEKIKNRMRQHLEDESSKQSFQTFWSTAYLENDWHQQLQFFNQQIRPLMATNYYRHIGENGKPLDRFWQIDLWFIGIFGFEYLIRTFYLSRSQRISWRDALLWRWYDIPLLLPFWRLLRILPVTVRLHQIGWLNLSRVQTQVRRNVAENLVAEISEMLVVQSFSLVQTSIEEGVIQRWLQDTTPMVNLNDRNEIMELTGRILPLTLSRVLPQVQPDLEALLHHALQASLHQLPLYPQWQQLPGLTQATQTLAQELTRQLTQSLVRGLEKVSSDEQGRTLVHQFSQHFLEVLRSELRNQQVLDEIQLLLNTMIEEMKLSLLQRLETEGAQKTVAELRRLQQAHEQTRIVSSVEILPGPPPKHTFLR